MPGFELPVNTVTATASVEISVGDKTRVVNSTIMVQTHKLEEISYIMEMAWDATRKQLEAETVEEK